MLSQRISSRMASRRAETSCAHSSFEGTDWHRRVLLSDRSQGWQPHKGDPCKVDSWASIVWAWVWRHERCKAHSRAQKSLNTEASRPDLCAGVSLASRRLSKATLCDVKALNKLVDHTRSTAEMARVIPCGVESLQTCSVSLITLSL